VTELRLRRAARAVILDPDDRVLLVRFELPEAVVWATPGGGLLDGETHEEGLRRELLEEAGLADFELGPALWVRTHVQPFASGLWDGQVEHVYLVRVPAFEPEPQLSWDELRSEGMTAVRWWSVDELEEARDLFAPRRLPVLLRELLREGPPAEPLEIGR
jgi:ADP-ribose pyrophosphatase YjhB (NUDIX family)